MNDVPLHVTAIGVAVAITASYGITVFCAWLGDHPTPFKFWRSYK